MGRGLALLVFVLLSTPALAAAPPAVRVAQGAVQGQVVDGLAVYRAIPYAEAPAGELRFHVPMPRKPWSGTFDATQEGPACPQPATLDPAGKASTDEDCLRLNVFAPLAAAATPRAVLVWVHGGGFFEGFGGAKQYNPSTLVREGDVVVVTINYRVGTFGLLATSGLSQANGQPSGNWATRDQIEALRWVQRNIAAFGGDPKNVTIVGESAGAASMLALWSSPAAKGLFAKVIAQSPPDDSHAWRRATMERMGDELAAQLGCAAGPAQVKCLRGLSVEAILKVRSHFGLVEEPEVLPVDPFIAFRSGRFNRVPAIIGSNLHEGYFSVSGTERNLGHAMTAEEYVTATRNVFAERTDAVMKAYPAASAPSPAAALGDAVGDLRFACMADLARSGAADFAPVYAFELNEPDPVQQQPRPKFSLANTSYHTSDLAYLFDFATSGRLEGDAAMLGRRMRAYWIQFAKTGVPKAAGQPEWPVFGGPGGPVLNLSNQNGVTRDFDARHRCTEMQKAGLVTQGPL